VHTFSPEPDSPTGQVADREVVANYDDLGAVRAFAEGVAAVTFEFENVPAATVAACEALRPVRPSGAVLNIAQNRLREKAFLAGAELPVTPFAPLREAADVALAAEHVGLPAVVKTAAFGYDGRGQARVAGEAGTAGVAAAWRAVGGGEAILERFVDFERELSVVAARGADGSMAVYDLFENRHRRHILDLTVAPAPVPAAVAREARRIAEAVIEALDLVGVICIELFLAADGRLLINELAPRPHNSGHLTIEASPASQFEQQVRALCGLPLGAPKLLAPAAMANLLGDLWAAGEPDWAAACAVPGVALHLYGKAEARPGRKMGHLTALGADPAEARRRVLAARRALAPGLAEPEDDPA
jgi:5-(carboxyamino)imidazole ribonucleotide synthase